jgi:cyclopropane-fatty-acyl-phospholipid synthase
MNKEKTMPTPSTADHFFKKLDHIQYGSVKLTTPDGKTRFFQGKQPGPDAQIHLKKWDVVPNLIARGDLAFAQDYQAGNWDSEDLQAIMSFALANDDVMNKYLHGNKLVQIGARLMYFLRSNHKSGSKRNISAHYDLGNAFYSLWLDRTMTYSSAIYSNPSENLESAQHNKYDRIINRLGKNSGSVLEIGCGWGGFAERALTQGDFNIKGITLSEEQHRFANVRLKNNAQITLEDYRDQTGKFDHIVSIEMFEAVGERYWPTYFNKINSLLKQNGRALIQTITMHDNHFEKYRKGSDMIRSFIFPGGMLPSPKRFDQEAQKAGLKIKDEFFFGQDYAKTLEEWLKNFDANINAVKAQGFNDEFIRLWRFYLAACIAGFRTGRTNVMQVELQHA